MTPSTTSTPGYPSDVTSLQAALRICATRLASPQTVQAAAEACRDGMVLEYTLKITQNPGTQAYTAALFIDRVTPKKQLMRFSGLHDSALQHPQA